MLVIYTIFLLDAYYTTLPRTSWYDVNYKGNVNKNFFRKYLAYSIEVEVTNDKTRRRRSVENADNFFVGMHNDIHSRNRRAVNGTTVNNVNFEIGTQSECTDPKNPDIACNGPSVDPNRSFRYPFH